MGAFAVVMCTLVGAAAGTDKMVGAAVVTEIGSLVGVVTARTCTQVGAAGATDVLVRAGPETICLSAGFFLLSSPGFLGWLHGRLRQLRQNVLYCHASIDILNIVFC